MKLKVASRLFVAFALLSVLGASFAVAAAANGPLTAHASVSGRAYLRTERGQPAVYGPATITFWSYAQSTGYPGAEHPVDGWAVTIEVGSMTYVWHVTSYRFAGRSDILILQAAPHPGVSGLTAGPNDITIIMRHSASRPLVVAFGRSVFFIGKTLLA